MIHSFFLLVSILLTTAERACSQNKVEKKQIQKIDAFIRKVKTTFPEIPGISVALVIKDESVLTKGYGFAELENKRKCTDRTPFYIASCTKSFTGLVAAMLDAEKTAYLSDPLSVYYPASFFTNPLPLDSITLLQLLTHTSGLENAPLTFRLAYSGDSDNDVVRTTLATNTKFNRRIGEFEYGNLGYNLYTMAIFDKFAIDWKEFLQDRIFDPLGMKNTYTRESEMKGRNFSAVPYGFDNVGNIVPLYLMKKDETMHSAGGIMSTAKDMARWLEVEINGGKLDGKQIISSTAVSIHQQEQVNSNRQKPPFAGEGKYALGLHKGIYLNQPVLYHFGGFPGFYAHFSFLPEQKIGIVVMTNEGIIGGDAANLIATYAYSLLIGEDSTDVIFEEKLHSLRESTTTKMKSFVQSMQEKASRPWLLTKEYKEYCGIFHNEAMGTISVTISDNKLQVNIGNLTANSLPYSEQETIRVELIPGRGEVIKFILNTEGEVEGLEYSDFIFDRKP